MSDRRRGRGFQPTEASRALGQELRTLRTLAALGQREIAAALRVSQSTVQRVELGEQRLGREQVEEWLRLTGASGDARLQVMPLVEAAHASSWKVLLAAEEVPHLRHLAARREATARLSRTWTPGVVPGLLQTAAYARAVIPLMDPTEQVDGAAAARARVERQQVLFEGQGRRFEFLLGEEALQWSPGPGVMPAQLDRLMSVSTLDNVEVAVLPAAREGSPGWHGFVFREAADDEPPYVTLELLHAGPVVGRPGGGQPLPEPLGAVVGCGRAR